MRVRRVTSEDWQALRDVRLRALADAPDAFGTTHAEALAQVISMWVDPRARGAGVGRALLDAVVAWARTHEPRVIRLSVTDGNDEARRLYQRFGFRDTGVTEPLRSNASLLIRELELT